ncbi:MAG: hypothetical protein ACE5IY_06060 [bacterium]
MEGIVEAWLEFATYREDQVFDVDSPQNEAFFPWFLFNWEPEEWEQEDEGVSHHHDPRSSPIAKSYLERHRWRLSEMERRFIELSCAKEFSFHEVLTCQPGTGFTLRDILLGVDVEVAECSASESARRGDILFAKVIQYDHLGLMVGCGPVLIPPRYKPAIVDLRVLMRSVEDGLTEEALDEWSLEIRDLYFDIYDEMHTPPQMCNTDGDPICWHNLFFEITAPEIAFEQLKALALDRPEDELLQGAEFDQAGNLKKVEFCWLRKGRSELTLGETLGHITIEGTELRASVNSRSRATSLRKEIEKRLGERVTHQATEEVPLESLLEETADIPEEDLATEESAQMGEAVDEILEAHWMRWLDERIPALGSLTPRQAAKDEDGRERLIALLQDFERHEKRKPGGRNQLEYIQGVRKELGLE